MPNIKPFRALRPLPQYADKIYINHNDAGDPSKAEAVMVGNPQSLLNISHGDKTLKDFLDSGILLEEPEDCFYVYRISMANHSQTGLVAAVDIQDYINGRIKKHELTRREKALIQEEQIYRIGGNIEPVLLTYDSEKHSEKIIEDWALSHDPIYDIYDAEGIHHEIWNISDESFIDKIISAANSMGSFYICDGHHRIEAAASHYTETGQSPYFMAAIFPSEEMLILDYNRAVQDLNGMETTEFLAALGASDFDVELVGASPIYPKSLGEYTMVLEDSWYRLTYNGYRDTANPVAELDVSILQNRVLDPILGVADPQHDDRLSFINGTKGLDALQKATHDGMKVAFALNPPSMEEIINVSEAGLTMPPKSTWFEPKLCGGLLILQF